MKKCLGFDTSNYTTSVALASMDDYIHSRKILDVDLGERGLRQSNALFLHTKNIPCVLSDLSINKEDIICVSASDKPREEDGSYMPCFLSGVNAGYVSSKLLDVPFYTFSHQSGHIMAILKTCNDQSLINKEFLAYHISGGTTELVHVLPDKDKGFKVNIVGGTKDISLGQLIDRCGVNLNYKFPCGNEMEKDSHIENLDYIKIKDNSPFYNISGIENKFNGMIKDGKSKEEIIKYVFSYCANVLIMSTNMVRETYKDLPIVFAGGVMRNTLIRKYIESNIDNVIFGSVELSSDNAVGISYLGLYKEGGLLG